MSSKSNNTKQKAKSSNKKTSNKKVVKNNKFARICFAMFFFVFTAVALVATVFGDLQQVVSNKKQTEELSNKYIELLEEEASLNSQVIKLQDPEYRARYARENQMYTKDGETILIIIDKNNQKMIKPNDK